MAEATPELSVLQRQIEATRQELASAIGDLELAAKDFVTPGHWRRVGARAWRRSPLLTLGAAFALGYWLERKLTRAPAAI